MAMDNSEQQEMARSSLVACIIHDPCPISCCWKLVNNADSPAGF